MSVGALLAEFWVIHRPRTKGSLNAYCMRNRAHTVRIEESVKDSPVFRRKVALAAQADQRERHGCGPGNYLLSTDPVLIEVMFWFDPDAEDCGDDLFPTVVTIGDLDKLLRNALDALQDSGLIRNDSQVTTILTRKRWARPGRSGARIRVWVDEEDGAIDDLP